MSTRILALVGSLRAGSYNRQLAEAAIKHAPEGIEVDIYEGLADVPFYNQDLDQPIAVPPSANALRSAVRSADGLLLVTPKYNGTIPATLKNAIDWISRPYPSDAIVDKPVAVIGSSGGRCGSAWAHEDTRETARIAGANVLNNVTLSVLHGATPFADTLPHATTKSPPRSPPSWPLWPRRPNPTKPHGGLMCTEPKAAAPPPARWSRHLARRQQSSITTHSMEQQRRHVMEISHATNACAPAMESHLITGGSNGLRGVTAGGQLRSHVCRSRVGADAGRRRSLGRASRRAVFDSDVVRVGDLGVDRRGVVGPGVVVDGVRGRVPCGAVDPSRTENR